MTKGAIIAVSGPVVDVSFEKGSIPAIREELRVTIDGSVRIMEVAQQMLNKYLLFGILASTNSPLL